MPHDSARGYNTTRASNLVAHPRVLATRPEAIRAIPGPVVYAARIGDYIKIGYTTNLHGRMHTFGRATLLAFALAESMDDESAIHDRLDGHAIKGREWYDPTDDAVLAVVNDMREALALPALVA